MTEMSNTVGNGMESVIYTILNMEKKLSAKDISKSGEKLRHTISLFLWLAPKIPIL